VPDQLLTIGELADRVGLRPSALRYYETCRRLGFSLSDVHELLRKPRGATQRARWRDLVEGKIAELDATAGRMRAMKRILATSRDCDCVDIQQCAAICARG
jgi:MerR family redox-sensitive transcriptional activator SoxR